jgi:predicted Zn-dependent peptidase
MIRDEKNAVSVSSVAGWPGSKYASLAVVFCYPAPGKTNAECEKVIYEEIARLQNELLPQEEIEKIKARAMSAFIGSMSDNLGLAQLLASYQQIWGSWREMFRELDRINQITPEDIQRVAKKYFTRNNRTVACLETIVEPASDNAETASKETKK